MNFALPIKLRLIWHTRGAASTWEQVWAKFPSTVLLAMALNSFLHLFLVINWRWTTPNC